MGKRVSVAGASGYAGGELLRLLAAHPVMSLAAATAASSAGRTVAEVHPQLPSLADVVLGPTDPSVLADADLVMLALPHGESAAVVRDLPPDLPVVDLGADFRLSDPAAWDLAYGGEHAGSWLYGLPELAGRREQVAASTRVANPGCYPTAVALGLAPLLADELVEPDDVVVVAASGTSGAGRSARPELIGSEVMGSVSAYKVGSHQHRPEMVQTLSASAGASVSLSFTPVLAPMPRGILATCTARLTSGTGTATLVDSLHEAYDDEPFVHVLAQGAWPRTASTVGSNAAHLQVVADDQSGRAVVVVAIDNLGKGAAGQAVQNANLMLGLDETLGLSIAGLAP